MTLTHFNKQGRGRMVDVSDKAITTRIAVAEGKIRMLKSTFQAIQNNQLKKGDVLAVAQIAGIQAVKKTSDLIPMAHPLLLTGIDITFSMDERDSTIIIQCEVSCEGKTGVEMEALTGVSISALTIYDMVKAVDKSMEIQNIYLVSKEGGKSGNFHR